MRITERQVAAQLQNKQRYDRVTAYKQHTNHSSESTTLNNLQSEIKTLTSLVANLTTHQQSQHRSRADRSPSQHRNPNYKQRYDRPQSPYENSNYKQRYDRSSSPHYRNYPNQTHRSSSNKRVTFGQNTSPQYTPNIQAKFCTICKKNNHYTDQCWFKSKSQDQRTHPSTASTPNTNPQGLFCRYCKRTNHNIDTCYRSKHYKQNLTKKRVIGGGQNSTYNASPKILQQFKNNSNYKLINHLNPNLPDEELKPQNIHRNFKNDIYIRTRIFTPSIPRKLQDLPQNNPQEHPKHEFKITNYNQEFPPLTQTSRNKAKDLLKPNIKIYAPKIKPNYQLRPFKSTKPTPSLKPTPKLEQTSLQNTVQNNKSDEAETLESQEINNTNATQILNSIELQVKQNMIRNGLLLQVSQDRIHKPRKHKNLLQEDIYDLIFNNENKPTESIPVLTVEVALETLPQQIVPCIIDTGCNINIIRADLVKGLNLNTTKIPTLISANNIPLKVLGSTKIIMKIGDLKLEDIFYVTPDLNNPLLVGNIFLFKNNMELNYKEKLIKITKAQKERSIPMNAKWHLQFDQFKEAQEFQIQQITDIATTQDIIIAPHQHIVVTTLKDVDHQSAFETDRNLRLKRKCHAYLSEGPNKEAIVNIYNASKFPKKNYCSHNHRAFK